MDTSLYVGLSHQVARRRQMDVIANNIANVNTTAFKREGVMFHEYVKDLEGPGSNSLQKVAFVEDQGTSQRMSEGPISVTDNPLDIAIGGKGMLVVEKQDGSTAYTRNGHLQLSDDGTLVTSTGNAVLDNVGRTIKFLPGSSDIRIAGDGTISTSQNGVIAKLNIVDFDNYSGLKKTGDSLYTTAQEPKPAEKYKISQGMIEQSNVSPIMEISTMISVSRSYVSVAKTLEDIQKIQTKAINSLAKVS